MSRDDYHVIVYKILSYLYACLKQGESIDIEYLTAENFKINIEYWYYILRHLLEYGYIEGIVLVPILGLESKGVKLTSKTTITPKGIEFLQDNSMMNKTKEFLQTIKNIMPNI